MLIEKYSFGLGDRFGKEGKAQLSAIQEINKLGYNVVPVWNKSYREHSIVHTKQQSVSAEAFEAVKTNGWKGNYYVDADHIGLDTVDQFIEHSNFFTIDVAHFIGKKPKEEDKSAFLKRYQKFLGKLSIDGIKHDFIVTEKLLENIADKFLVALSEVKLIFDHIVAKKGRNNFIPEVSMDECEHAQSPIELFFILAELRYQDVEVQTIAPKFSGLFAKGVDYAGDIKQFALEFEQDIAVIKFVIEKLGLPTSLKLSVHSGSDKFSIYPIISKAIQKFDAGIHIKTAGTTWLEEVIGLAESGGEGLEIAKIIYEKSMDRFEELTGPYTSVLSIDKSKLPSAQDVNYWTSKQFSSALTHDQSCMDYNTSFRQLIHVGYKIAAELGEKYFAALDANRSTIENNVKYNLLERHLKLLFINP